MRPSLIALAAVVLVGCDDIDASRIPLLCECFSEAAYRCIRAEKLADDVHDGKCCGDCGGTGKVRSGDGLAIVDCPCPETCSCKQKKAKR